MGFFTKKKGLSYDPYLIEQIQPEGGISFRDDRYVTIGNGYEACIHIFDYPEELDPLWLDSIINIDNTIGVIDISTENMNQVKTNINKSIQEQKQRLEMGKDYSDISEAKTRLDELKRLYEEIQHLDQVIKLIHARVFVYAHTKDELENKCKDILIKLETNAYKTAIFINETKEEWCSIFQPYKKQKKNTFSLYGQPITSESLAGGYPFNYLSLEDPCGTLIGFTKAHGMVLYDGFHKTKIRTHYNSTVTGDMGAGKSTLLKKLMHDRAVRGDFIRTFDLTGEFKGITKNLGGCYLPMDGTKGIVNILQILKASENEETNFSLHMSKIGTWYQLINPLANEYDIVEIQELLTKLYIRFGFLDINGGIGDRKISEYTCEKYPILSDLDNIVQEEIEELIEKIKVSEVKVHLENELLKKTNISKIIKNIIQSYGKYFNGITSINNILDEQVLTFDFSIIKNIAPNIFDGILFNTLSLCWDNAVKNGTIMKYKWDRKEIRFEDVVRYLLIIDESHHIVNINKLHALRQIMVYAREGRKYFAGICLASQSVRDYFAENTNSNGIDELKTLFGLMQYKFIFKQDESCLELIERLYGKQLNEDELAKIPVLQQGQVILTIQGDKNIEFDVNLTDEENMIFEGGA